MSWNAIMGKTYYGMALLSKARLKRVCNVHECVFCKMGHFAKNTLSQYVRKCVFCKDGCVTFEALIVTTHGQNDRKCQPIA